MHDLLRTSILDAARQAASSTDWGNVRMVDIAETVGVSRQTIYNEFGTKEDLAQALFAREVDTFKEGLAAQIDRADDLSGAARNALTWMLTEARNHAMVQWVLRGAREQNSDSSLLPLLTVRADRFALPIRAMLLETFSSRWPGTDQHRAELAIDLIIRWVIAQIVLPSDFDEAEVIDRIVEMTEFSLRPARGALAGHAAGA